MISPADTLLIKNYTAAIFKVADFCSKKAAAIAGIRDDIDPGRLTILSALVIHETASPSLKRLIRLAAEDSSMEEDRGMEVLRDVIQQATFNPDIGGPALDRIIGVLNSMMTNEAWEAYKAEH